MCTPWTRRVPRFCLDYEPDAFCSPSNRAPTEHRGSKRKGDCGNRRGSYGPHKCSPGAAANAQVGGGGAGGTDDVSRWVPQLGDHEDYIVFCFGDDQRLGGGVKSDRVIAGRGGEMISDGVAGTERGSKFTEEEDHMEEGEEDDHYGFVTREGELVISDCIEVEEEEKQIYVNSKVNKRGDRLEMEGGRTMLMGSAATSASCHDQSDGSSSSFAFPTLPWEWIGSPIRMPKSDKLCLRKHKTRRV